METKTPRITQSEINEEWQYRFSERIGILCDDRQPTPLEIEIATREANAWLAELTTYYPSLTLPKREIAGRWKTPK